MRISASSLPARGAWIETFICWMICWLCWGRSPHGERGLKHNSSITQGSNTKSLPARGAWIETMYDRTRSAIDKLSLPARGAWIETKVISNQKWAKQSRSPHGERGLKRI